MALVKKCKTMMETGEYRMPTRIKDVQTFQQINVTTMTYAITGVFVITLNNSWYPGRLYSLAAASSSSAALTL